MTVDRHIRINGQITIGNVVSWAVMRAELGQRARSRHDRALWGDFRVVSHFERSNNVVEVSPDQLKQAVEQQHGGTAMLADVVSVKEEFQGKTVWEGMVHVFDLDGNTQSTRAYAWSSPIEGSTKRRFFAVLHLGGIRSPQDAVRAAIVAE
ncbi:MAG: hypothetical protein GEU76_03870 [Alphaproteobacteria bacterium]|nr:hypothetical protein [Alphaproteobacteria bacterium]